MKRAWVALLASALLATAACSADSSPDPVAPATTAPAPATPEATPTTAGSPASDCLNGTYRIARFVGVGDKATYGTGEGGDVKVSFTEGSYRLVGDGKEPINVVLGGQRGKLSVDGSIDGTYTGSGAQVRFTVGKTSGSAKLTGTGQAVTLGMKDVANVLAPEGVATLACGNDQVILLLSDTRLELERA